jgi:hypothetical protein
VSTIAVTGRVVLVLLAALFGVAAGLGALLGATTGRPCSCWQV